MKIWYDACTGKHVRYGTAIARRLRKARHEVIFTTREHPDTLALAKVLGETPIVVGRYDPASLSTRLEGSSNRILQFLKLFKNDAPDIAISHQSIELCRVAFGLGIPIILTADTPYAEAVNRLTIPLANTVVASKAIPKHVFQRYGAQKIIQFNGVDEVAWTQGVKPFENYDLAKPLIVVRQMENRAAYALGRKDVTEELARKLAKLGNVLFIARYGEQGKERFFDTATLVSDADLVLSMGGTIAREAALQGVPSIVLPELGQTYVNEYLTEMGFPLFIVQASDVLATVRKHLGKRWDVKEKLAKLENPVNVIEKIVEEK